ncbi:unnamed protein product, partial [Meganyctiphanes norvegica]
DLVPTTCPLSCKGGADYWRGTKRYKFSGSVEASPKDFTFWPSDDAESDIIQATKYEAVVDLVTNSACEGKIKVTDFAADTQSEENSWFAQQVMAYDLFYSTNKYRMQFICANSEEEAAATNFKRSLLKLFYLQNNWMPQVDANDECDISQDYTGEIIISRSNCTSKGYFPKMSSAQMKHSKGFSNMPLIKRSQICRFPNDTSTINCIEEVRISEVTASGLQEFAFFRINSNLDRIEELDDQVELPFYP